MTVSESPALQRRRLGNELRRLREAAGKKLEDVAECLECSEAKVSRIESGKVPALARDIRDMLDCYGVAGDERAHLLELAKAAKRQGWWHSYAEAVPKHFPTFVGLEAGAAEEFSYQPTFVPGLLQTANYARELMLSDLDADPEQVERAVELRVQRQQRVTDGENPLRLHAIVDEAVLNRWVGGDRIMREQFDHLAAMAELPNVRFQIVGNEVGAYPGMGVPFIMLTFPDPGDGGVVVMEQQASALYLEGTETVERYTLAFKKMSEIAIAPHDSAVLAKAMSDR